MSIKNWIESKMFWLKTGYGMEVLNDGNPVQPIVIRYKDYFFEIMLDAETGEPIGKFGWSDDAGMFETPIREHLIASSSEAEAAQKGEV